MKNIHNPQLFIDEVEKQDFMNKAQIKSYSITPTTLKEIHFKLQD